MSISSLRTRAWWLACVSLFFLIHVRQAVALDYRWTSPSTRASEAMPVGGGGIGVNVWCDSTGNVQGEITLAGSFDENNTLLKMLRFSFAPFADWAAGGFQQTLHTNQGTLTLTQGGTTVTLWCDVRRPVLHLDITSPHPTAPTLWLHSWRTDDSPFTRAEGQQSSLKWLAPKQPQSSCVTHRDSLLALSDAFVFFHHNQDSTVFDYTVQQQGLQAFRDSLYNPLAGRIFGGRLTGGRLVTNAPLPRRLTDIYGRPFAAWPYASANGAARRHHFVFSLACTQGDLVEWQHAVDEHERAVRTTADARFCQQWWRDYMARAEVSVPDAAQADSILVRMLENATLFRYMMGCSHVVDAADPYNLAGREVWPTKFNGGLFALEPLEVDSASIAQYRAGKFHPTPDYRRWGGGTHTAQNQRLLYWSMLKSGDYDLLTDMLDFYLRMLPTASLRVRHAYGHDGACFAEQIENFGLPNPAEYGTKRPAGFDPCVEYNAWLEYEWDTVLEFCDMALEAYRYTLPLEGAQKTALPVFPWRKYETWIDACLTFFDRHYQWRAAQLGRKTLDATGHLILYPGSACETFKMTYNSASTIAALRRVTLDYLRVLDLTPQSLPADSSRRVWLTDLLSRIPPIPSRWQQGRCTIAPAEVYARVNNVETPQLYPVWPWRLITLTDTVGAPSTVFAIADTLAPLQWARQTYLSDTLALRFRTHVGWKQDNIWAARLGLTEEAFSLTRQKLTAHPYRFPAYFGPGYDWSPDHNWGGSALIGLYEMLLQEEEKSGEVRCLPAWPQRYDVRFRLHATRNRRVEVTLKSGRLTKKIY